MKHAPVALDEVQRNIVDSSIREVCELRGFGLRALNVRTNHVHVVVTANTRRPDLVLNAFKAKATGLLRRKGHWPLFYSPWSDGGSTRYVWTETSLDRIIKYVLHRQHE